MEHRLHSCWSRLSVYLLATACLWLAACANYRELGDAAYQRNQWEVAFVNYQRAMQNTLDPAELQQLKLRLEECRENAGAQYLASAQDLVGIGDFPNALAHAERAFRYTPTTEVQALVRDLRAKEGARLLDVGKAAVQGRQWDQAVRSLERAQKLAPTQEGATLLAAARAEHHKLHEAEFQRLWGEAQEQLHARNWARAVSLYGAAHHHGKTRQSLREQKFVRRMAEAESLCSQTPFDAHRVAEVTRKYRQALNLGLDTAYVQARLQMIEPGDYVITLNRAVILPFKPGSRKPWDGRAVRRVRGADELLRELGAFAAPEVEIADLGGRVFRRMSSRNEAPDCYPLMKIGNRVVGGPHCAQKDDLRPAWTLQMRVKRANVFDKRVVQVRVMDRDVRGSEPVGSFELPLAELVLNPGEQVIRFFDANGRLQAGGLLAITITMQRL